MIRAGYKRADNRLVRRDVQIGEFLDQIADLRQAEVGVIELIVVVVSVGATIFVLNGISFP